ncbi:hypothetical protein HPB51_029676 [Rhipicephalus microplus]|uniref:Uncharacterized protein n=1 Tax=Rhipicephalus microplus TaxID=6941 RepID=A0A9J6CTW2_RHIMP|nr:hypothetical protein HPB51_029676 [Rhipicephalus microplus]
MPQVKDLTLLKAEQICKAAEVSAHHNATWAQAERHVAAVKQRQRFTCSRCDRTHDRKKCPSFGKTCFAFKGANPFVTCCRKEPESNELAEKCVLIVEKIQKNEKLKTGTAGVLAGTAILPCDAAGRWSVVGCTRAMQKTAYMTSVGRRKQVYKRKLRDTSANSLPGFQKVHHDNTLRKFTPRACSNVLLSTRGKENKQRAPHTDASKTPSPRPLLKAPVPASQHLSGVLECHFHTCFHDARSARLPSLSPPCCVVMLADEEDDDEDELFPGRSERSFRHDAAASVTEAPG